MSAATGAERVLTPGVEFVLEVVRMEGYEQYPSLMPALYPGDLATVSKSFGMATVLRLFGTLDAMWLAFKTLANNLTHAINSETYFYGETYFCLPASICRVHGRRDRAIIRLK